MFDSFVNIWDPKNFIVFKGEEDGHPFRGNQYTEGGGGGNSKDNGDKTGPVKISPKKLSREMESESSYAYHATNEERLYEIADSGNLNTHKPNYGTDQETWPDGSTDKRAYFSNDAKVVWQFAPEDGKPVVIRTSNKKLKAESTGDIYSTKPVSTKELEYLGNDDKWHPVTDLKTKDNE